MLMSELTDNLAFWVRENTRDKKFTADKLSLRALSDLGFYLGFRWKVSVEPANEAFLKRVRLRYQRRIRRNWRRPRPRRCN